ncbi:MAG: hypothetical protein DRI89_05445 [Bacteroidetes bacterium]|nr:MAG: hypothetical protein DRI89_05445 [Bacteroidota bacterium]
MLKMEVKISKEKKDLWLKAAVVGGLWASVEIIIGSFLHNARLPFAGTTLAFAGTILLIGFYQIWPQKGLIIRAGLITAIMKSVSPSAFIIGPMTGIMFEAVLLELVILIAGNNLISLMFASSLSLSSALFHKVMTLLIMYGFDLIKVYVNIINFALKQFGIQDAEALEILLALLSVYVVFGIVAALMGYFIGRKAIKLKADQNDFQWDENAIQKNDFFEIKEGQTTSITLLFIHILAIPVGLLLLNYFDIWIGLTFVIIYILVFGTRYRYSLRRLRKPVFWMQLVLIVVLSALFWDTGNESKEWVSMQGIIVGLEMLIRALFVVVAFSALSVELRNEKVRNYLFQVGFGQFYQSIGLAFSALPMMISLLPTSKEIIKSPMRSMLKPLIMAEKWLEMFEERGKG